MPLQKNDFIEIEFTAKTKDGVVMGIEHKTLPISGVQFHPESFMTESGFVLIENFLKQGPLNIMRKLAAA